MTAFLGGVSWRVTYDAFLYGALKQRLDPKGIRCWDIGSHIGYHAFGFAGLGAEVLAFEPNTQNAARFRQHLARNPEHAKRIRLMEAAVSDHEGKVTFVQCANIATGSSGSHLSDGLPPLTSYPASESVTVDAVRLDTLIERGEKPPDVLKIDVEGAEMLVLRGASKLLREKHPLILMEVHHICLMFDLQPFLADHGYTATLLDQEHASPSRCFVLAAPRSVATPR